MPMVVCRFYGGCHPVACCLAWGLISGPESDRRITVCRPARCVERTGALERCDRVRIASVLHAASSYGFEHTRYCAAAGHVQRLWLWNSSNHSLVAAREKLEGLRYQGQQLRAALLAFGIEMDRRRDDDRRTDRYDRRRRDERSIDCAPAATARRGPTAAATRARATTTGATRGTAAATSGGAALATTTSGGRGTTTTGGGGGARRRGQCRRRGRGRGAATACARTTTARGRTTRSRGATRSRAASSWAACPR